MKSRKAKKDHHQILTDQIIDMMESTKGSFEMPWHKTNAFMFPANAVTKNRYNGINWVSLVTTAEKRNYASGKYATYRQWASVDAQVRSGETGTTIFYYQPSTHDDKTTSQRSGEHQEYTRWFCKVSTVFAQEQVDGNFEEVSDSPTELNNFTLVDDLVSAHNITLNHQGERAFYSPTNDAITMPSIDLFRRANAEKASENYYAVLLHEMVHWTLPENRCNRLEHQSYAFEELVAELGSAFLCAELGISNSPREDHAHYLNNWIKALKDDKNAIFKASSLASKACRYLLDKDQS